MAEEVRGEKKTVIPESGSLASKDGSAGQSECELRGWLSLGAVRGLSGHGVVELVNRFGSSLSVIEACKSSTLPEGIRPKLASAIALCDKSPWADKELEAAAKGGVTILTYADPRYPALLKEIPDPPHLIYVRGRGLELFSLPSVGVVGTRLATGYGKIVSESLSRDLANLGIVVVSGGARGCDSAAHKGVLKAGGATIAVLGTGVDMVYPKENAGLYEEIVENGLLVSEFPMSTPPAVFNFPRRNRIISGLSLGVLIVEAPVRSGALMTARFALEQNREVFAVPGAVTSEKSKGVNRLLKEGAALVESAADIVEGLSLSIVGSALKEQPDGIDSENGEDGTDALPDRGDGVTKVIPSLAPEEELIFNSLGTEAIQIDMVIAATRLSVAEVSSALLGLELKGLVEQRPGKFFVKSF